MSSRARDVAQWGGWRRIGPAAGSVAFHIAAAGLIALSLGAALSEETPRKRERPIALDFVMLEVPESEPAPVLEVRPEPPRQELPPLEPPEQLPEPPPPEPEPPKVEPPPAPEPPKPEPPKPEPQLTSEPTPEPPRPVPQASVTPPPRAVPRPEPTPEPPRPEPPKPEPPKPAPAATDPRKEKEAATAAPKPILPAPGPAPADAGSVFMPPSVLVEPKGGPAGLRSLAYGDPCESRFGKKPKECVDDWRGRVGTMDSLLPRSKDELKQHYAEFMTPCPHKVGCEGGEWISTNGTRAPQDNTSAASGGPASVGGINDVVGRATPKPDYIDPGFGD